MKRDEPEHTQPAEEFDNELVQLDEHLKNNYKERKVQKEPGRRGLFNTVAILLKKDPQQVENEAFKEMDSIFPEWRYAGNNPAMIGLWLEVMVKLYSLHIIINKMEDGVFKVTPFDTNPEPKSPHLHIACCGDEGNYHFYPILPMKGKEKLALDEPTPPSSDSEEGCLQRGEEDQMKLGYGEREFEDAAFAQSINVVSELESEEDTRNKVRQLADKIQREHKRSLSFEEYCQCVSLVASNNVTILNNFHQELLQR